MSKIHNPIGENVLVNNSPACSIGASLEQKSMHKLLGIVAEQKVTADFRAVSKVQNSKSEFALATAKLILLKWLCMKRLSRFCLFI